jgi:hypothetical protein
MWGCRLRLHPHIYLSLLLTGGFFSALIYISLPIQIPATMLPIQEGSDEKTAGQGSHYHRWR